MADDYAVFGVQHPDLSHLPSEAATLAAALGCEATIGDVTESLIRQVLRGRQVRGMYIGSHATPDGIILSSGFLSASSLAAIASNAIEPGGWLFIATCYSDEFLQTVQRGASVDIMAAVSGELPDERAWSFVANLADSIRRNGPNMYAAWYRTRAQSIADFRYWPHPDGGKQIAVNEQQYTNGTKTTLEYIRRDLDRIERELAATARAQIEIGERVVRLELGRTTVNVSQPARWETYLLVIGMIASNAMIWLLGGGG